MFTGIVETRGTVLGSEARPFGRRLTIDAGDWRGRSGALCAGDSVAVNGVCLTVAEIAEERLGFDVIPETLAGSTLGDLKAGDVVNLESPLTATTPLGGHFVQGHIDGVGRIETVRRDEEDLTDDEKAEATGHVLVVRPPTELMDYLTPKGSVTIEGVSLTIAAVGAEARKADEVSEDTFAVALIPTTLKQTTLGKLAVGDRVNLETDMVTRAVVHWLRRQGEGAATKGVSWSRLREAGFVA